MRIVRRTAWLGAILMVVAFGCGRTGSAPGGGPLRVVYIGNSRVYYYNQPAMLAELARANGRSVEVSMIVEGGATLADLIAKGAIDSVRTGGWDVVVLNEQSTWGLTRFVEGALRVPEAPDRFYARVDSFVRAASDAGARVVLVAHARQRDMPERDGDALIRAFARAADDHRGIEVTPLQVAWRLAAERAPGIDLYDGDGNHPTRVSALLTAALTYRVIFGDVPVRIPDVIRGPWIELNEGTLMPDSVVELVRIDSATAADVRTVTAAAAAGWPEAVRRARASTATDEGAPGLAEPATEIDPPALRGRWVGELRLYPRFATWPATMTLDLATTSDPPTAALRVSFGGQPDDVVVPMLPVSNEGTYLQFVDPDGPNGGIVRYRLVPVGDSLVGIAEFVTDGPLYGIGSLALRRAERD